MGGRQPVNLDSLYNKEIKMKYLAQCRYENINEVQTKLATCSEKIERPLKKDLYELKIKDYQMALQKLDIFNIPEIRHYIVYIGDYVKWAASEGLCQPIPSLAKVVDIRAVDMHDVVKRTMIKDEHHLLNIIETGRDLTEVPNVVLPLIFSWLGIHVSDMAGIMESDFSESYRRLIYKENQINIPECLAKVLYNYSKQDVVYTKNKQGEKALYKTTSPYFMKYTFGKNVLESYNNKKLSVSHINAMFVKFNGSYDSDKYSYNKSSFEISGEFYRIYKSEINNGSLSAKDIIQKKYPHWQSSRILDWACMYERYVRYMWG